MNVLVGYDGSNTAKKALILAKEHANVFGAKLEVVMSMAQSRKLLYSDICSAEYRLQKEVRGLLNGDKTPYETHLYLRKQNVGEALVEFAKNYNIDVIIIGVKRESKLGKFLLGSTAQYVILNAPCPVVAVK